MSHSTFLGSDWTIHPDHDPLINDNHIAELPAITFCHFLSGSFRTNHITSPPIGNFARRFELPHAVTKCLDREKNFENKLSYCVSAAATIGPECVRIRISTNTLMTCFKSLPAFHPRSGSTQVPEEGPDRRKAFSWRLQKSRPRHRPPHFSPAFQSFDIASISTVDVRVL
jgi:hypothetical protein